jgi:hypothetical protein
MEAGGYDPTDKARHEELKTTYPKKVSDLDDS